MLPILVATIQPWEDQDHYIFPIGSVGQRIRVNITRVGPGGWIGYGRVTWIKRPGVHVITSGKERTPVGHWETPYNRSVDNCLNLS